MGAEKASGVLASSQGNAFCAAAPGAKPGEFAKPAPVVANTASAGANAGKENATTTRGATASASTSGEPEQAEKRWQVCNSLKPSTTAVNVHRAHHMRRFSGPRRRSLCLFSQTDTAISVDVFFSHARRGHPPRKGDVAADASRNDRYTPRARHART
jgi:hypothetical protein